MQEVTTKDNRMEEEFISRAYKRLEAASESGRCAIFINSLAPVERVNIFNKLEYERLERKHNDILEIYRESDESWHETLLVALFKTLSCTNNREVYMELARRIGYNAILREKDNTERIEALLLCASGILDIYPKDSYILKLRHCGEHLLRKYNITPLHHSNWIFNKERPTNHPAIRLAQVANLFAQKQLFFDKVTECETLDDIINLFEAKASPYWQTHFAPGKVSRGKDANPKRIGKSKCNIIGINVVVTLQYAYGNAIGDDNIVDRAERLNETLLPEENKYTKKWKRYNLTGSCSFDSQALIQLYTEYCTPKRCRCCPVAQKAIKNLSWIEDYK